ncbi:hypothetical protein P3W45_001105 [Vairimorpha bombi]
MMLICHLITLLCSLEDQKNVKDTLDLKDIMAKIDSACLYQVQSAVYNTTIDSTASIITELADTIEQDKLNKSFLDEVNIAGSNVDNTKCDIDYNIYIMQYKIAQDKNKKLYGDIKSLEIKRNDYVMKYFDSFHLNILTKFIDNIMKDLLNINKRMRSILENIETKSKRHENLKKNILSNSEDILEYIINRLNGLIKYLADKDLISRFVFENEGFMKMEETEEKCPFIEDN